MKLRQLFFSVILLFTLLGVVNGGEIITVPSKGIGSISKAIVKARPGDTVLVKDGVYKENIYVKNDIVVKAKNQFKAVLDGSGHGTVVTLGGGSGIEGFVVRNGTIGVFTRSARASIKKCKIVSNWMTGIIAAKYLPAIEDNIIAFNRGSGIVTWDTRATNSAIEHNTIAYNVGFGTYLGGKSIINFEHNTVAFNQKFGLEMHKDSKESTVKRNNFYENLYSFKEDPEGNFSFDPAFTAARGLLDFTPDSKLCCSIKSSNNENLGSRVTK